MISKAAQKRDLDAAPHSGHILLFSDVLKGDPKWFYFWEARNNSEESNFINCIDERKKENANQIKAIRKQVKADLIATGRHSQEEENRLVEAYQEARKIPSREALEALRELVMANARIIRKEDGKWKIPKEYQATLTRDVIFKNILRAEPRKDKKIILPAPEKPKPAPVETKNAPLPPHPLDIALKKIGMSRKDHEALKQQWSIHALTPAGKKMLDFYFDVLGFDLRHEKERDACDAWAKITNKDERLRKSAARPKRVLPKHGVGLNLKKIVKKRNQRPIPAVPGDHAGIAE